MRRPRLLVPWGAGWLICMIAMALWSYDGILSLVFQPISAAVVSGVCVAAVLPVGLLLWVGPIGRLWDSRPRIALMLLALCLATMCLGSTLGLNGPYTDPETGRAFVALHPVAAIASYLVLLFTIAYWPVGEATRRA